MSEAVLRTNAVRTGVRLEIVTVAWMVVEAALAIGAGILARSVLLTAFGVDSLIELLSGLTLLWRLSREAGNRDVDRVDRMERRAIGVSAALLGLLCVYVIISSAAGLLLRIEAQPSLLGVVVAAAAVVVMPVLAWRKRIANQTIQSAALRADIAESATCAYLAVATLIGLLLNGLLGWWWAEYLAAFALLFWLVGETREALAAARAGRGRCDDD